MKSDIEIATEAKVKKIEDIAREIGIDRDDIDLYGKYKCKILLERTENLKYKKGNLILVTAINPTPFGEGKSTTSVALGQGLSKIGENAIISLREPSLGPVFGLKGGACGGGYSQVLPMEDINLHFTGDMHAITATNNLLSAAIDNHIHFGNELQIDVNNIVFKRVVDMNDRALRKVIIGLGGEKNGKPREDSYTITVASEIMAILCLSKSFEDMKERFSKIIVAFNYDKKPIYVKDLKVEGAMTLLMKDAINPNLVQTTENTPALIHGGPFANIAHGCSSIISTDLALKLADYVVTEAGFGADLGGEKFFNIKCREGNLKPKLAVIVATIRGLKYNSEEKDLDTMRVEDNTLKNGFSNIEKHYENIKKFGVIPVIALNLFDEDTKEEIDEIFNLCKEKNYKIAICDGFKNGGNGAVDLAKLVVSEIENSKTDFKLLYDINDSIQNKIKIIAKEIYGISEVTFSSEALEKIELINNNNLKDKPICIAKTQYLHTKNKNSSTKSKILKLEIQNISISNGAGFIVAYAGNIMTMPGLPKKPAFLNIDIDENKKITGLF